MGLTGSHYISDRLRHAYRMVFGLAPEGRVYVIKVYLRYLLKDFDRDAAASMLDQLKENFAPSGDRKIVSTTVDEERIRKLLSKVLFNLLQDENSVQENVSTDYLINQSEGMIDQAIVSLHALNERMNTKGGSLKMLMNQIDNYLYLSNKGMEKAAVESFERLLNALNPESVKSKVTKKALGTEAGYKASLYDAFCDKYQQLLIYNSRGRLVKDFKAIYKMYLKQNMRG